MQWVAAGVGGYLTGRLRVKWIGLHTHEVFFRDTANGFVSWAVASIIVVAFLASASSSILGAGAHVAAALAGGATQDYPSCGSARQRYGGSDGLFHRQPLPLGSSEPNASSQDVRGETLRILARGVQNGGVPDADKAYLAQLVVARTGLPQDAAQKRVNDVLAQEQAAETKARSGRGRPRKAGAAMSIYTGVRC